MRLWMLGLFAMGCGESISGTVVSSTSPRDCPSDRPIEESDLDCVCGAVQTYTLVDTVVPDACDELWCHPEDLELECIVYPTGSSSTSDSGG
jgi:hypothetical protein